MSKCRQHLAESLVEFQPNDRATVKDLYKGAHDDLWFDLPWTSGYLLRRSDRNYPLVCIPFDDRNHYYRINRTDKGKRHLNQGYFRAVTNPLPLNTQARS